MNRKQQVRRSPLSALQWARDLHTELEKMKSEWGWNSKYPLNLKAIGAGHDLSEFEKKSIYLVNRQSTKLQDKNENYVPKINSLIDWCDKNQLKHVDKYSFTGCGKLDSLETYLYTLMNNETEILEMPYFDSLKRYIYQILQSIPIGQQFFLIFDSIDRLCRSTKYNGRDKKTWKLTSDDFHTFELWLNHCFGERVADIGFRILVDASPGIIRGRQTKAGLKQKNKLGGRPRKEIKYKKQSKCLPGELKRRRDSFFALINKYREEGLDNNRINQTVKKIFEETVPSRTIRHWLQSAGLSQKRGRPSKDQQTNQF